MMWSDVAASELAWHSRSVVSPVRKNARLKPGPANAQTGGSRRLFDKGELGHRAGAAAERPQHRAVGRARGGADADVVVAIGLQERRLEQRQLRHVRHPLPHLGLGLHLLLFVL